MQVLEEVTEVSYSKKPHPVVAAIVRELVLVDGKPTLPDERFEFWVKRLWTRYRRSTDQVITHQLGVLAFRLSSTPCPAALQFFALATLGLPPTAVEEHARTDLLFGGDPAKHVRKTARAIVSSAVTSAFVRPSPASGVRMMPKINRRRDAS